MAVGLNYHLGLFKQEFKDENYQNAVPNPWIEKESWLTKNRGELSCNFWKSDCEFQNV